MLKCWRPARCAYNNGIYIKYKVYYSIVFATSNYHKLLYWMLAGNLICKQFILFIIIFLTNKLIGFLYIFSFFICLVLHSSFWCNFFAINPNVQCPGSGLSSSQYSNQNWLKKRENPEKSSRTHCIMANAISTEFAFEIYNADRHKLVLAT